ncbi:hypothetical protein H310_08719 [Aphanomyces invadans]|uniref:Uncharacterized protein n=1 Tax=Aphanomyces invadans TaxID=157072 RepID=A0A024TY83_9STRA|nr:hypothetical protein H310_08719 [Aphanomyces invadans]ETV98601.1 hypothetical protein H310_08719 [Aphanomyces invadans]|eukprot:XP_008872798.1 hypothetical protein H310_08719 [Aphanomyces invadans]
MLAKGLPPPAVDADARSRARSTSGGHDLSSPPSSSSMHKRFPSNSSILMPQHLEPLPKLPPTSASHGNLVLFSELEAVDKFDTRTSPPKHKLEKLDAPKSPPKTDYKDLPVVRHNCLQAIAPTPSLLEHAKPIDTKANTLAADAKDHSASSSHLRPLDKLVDVKLS